MLLKNWSDCGFHSLICDPLSVRVIVVSGMTTRPCLFISTAECTCLGMCTGYWVSISMGSGQLVPVGWHKYPNQSNSKSVVMERWEDVLNTNNHQKKKRKEFEGVLLLLFFLFNFNFSCWQISRPKYFCAVFFGKSALSKYLSSIWGRIGLYHLHLHLHYLLFAINGRARRIRPYPLAGLVRRIP